MSKSRNPAAIVWFRSRGLALRTARRGVLLSLLLVALGATPALAGPSDLFQKPGLLGCITETGQSSTQEETAGQCTDGTALLNTNAVKVSPDGKNAYVASDAAVTIFDRDAATGALTQKPGTAGCISDTGRSVFFDETTAGECEDAAELDRPKHLAISPDGNQVYVVSENSDSLTTFDRDPTTGQLTQKQGTAGCIADTGDGVNCADALALDRPMSVVVSPEGNSLYVTSAGSDSLTIFDRNTTTGVVTQKQGPAGCISDVEGCTSGGELGSQLQVQALGGDQVTVSPDGKNVYVAAQGGWPPEGGCCGQDIGPGVIHIYNRDPATGELTFPDFGERRCISAKNTFGACDLKPAVKNVTGITVSPDNKDVYAVTLDGAVLAFDRVPADAPEDAGFLFPKEDPAFCANGSGELPHQFTGETHACQVADGLELAHTVTVSPDGLSVYVAARNTLRDTGGVAIFDRNPTTGVITQRPRPLGCITLDGDNVVCKAGRALAGARGVAVSPDGKNVYLAAPGNDGVAIFDRGEPRTTPPVGGAGGGGRGGGGTPPQPSAAFADCPSSVANVIRGSATNDRINGTPRPDRIFAGTGNDTVDGLAADDCIDLGPGADRGQGGDGADLVVGGLGADRIAGNLGNDRLRGGAAADRLIGGFGDDTLHGQSGSDRINAERGRDRVNGGSANDVISAGSSGDRVAGDQGNDSINGNSGNDSIKGNSGRDRIKGSSGRDSMSGGSGNDRIEARDGRRDRINCGSGRDLVVADSEDRVAGNCEVVRPR